MDKINIYGALNRALEAAKSGDPTNMVIYDLDKEEATAIAVLMTTAMATMVRLAGGEITAENRQFLQDLREAINKGSSISSDFGKHVNYNDATRMLVMQFPAHDPAYTQSMLNNMYGHIFSSQYRGELRADLPDKGLTACYAWACGDSTGLVGNKAVAELLWRCLDSMASAHGFKNVAFTSMENIPPYVLIERRALDMMSRMESLEPARGRAGEGDSPPRP